MLTCVGAGKETRVAGAFCNEALGIAGDMLLLVGCERRAAIAPCKSRYARISRVTDWDHTATDAWDN